MGDRIVISFMLIFSCVNSKAEEFCRPEGINEKFLYENEFHWNFGLTEMLNKFEEILTSGKRLSDRLYFDVAEKKYFLPYLKARGGAIEVPDSFLKNVRRHVELALQRQYAEAVFFPDLGHSHFLIPEEKMKQEYATIPVREMSRLYEAFLKDSDILVLYHTAEQLKTPHGSQLRTREDRHNLWRLFTRNVIGDNITGDNVYVLQNHESPANTLSSVPGYFWWSAGFNISASESGCIEYSHNGRKLRFDLSLFDLAPEPGKNFRGFQNFYKD